MIAGDGWHGVLRELSSLRIKTFLCIYKDRDTAQVFIEHSRRSLTCLDLGLVRVTTIPPFVLRLLTGFPGSVLDLNVTLSGCDKLHQIMMELGSLEGHNAKELISSITSPKLRKITSGTLVGKRWTRVESALCTPVKKLKVAVTVTVYIFPTDNCSRILRSSSPNCAR